MTRAVVGVLWIVVALCVGAAKAWAVDVYKHEISFEDSLDENSTEETKNELAEDDIDRLEESFGEEALVPFYYEDGEGEKYLDLSQIPEEIWFRILEFLDPAALGRFAQVNSFFLRIIQDEALLGPRDVWPHYAGLGRLSGCHHRALNWRLFWILKEFDHLNPALSHAHFLYLLKKVFGLGANAHAVDNRGQTPLHRAAMYGHEGVVRVLLDHDANANAVDNQGQTPLRRAAMYGHEGVVRVLLDHDANANAVDNQGLTPLHRAAMYGHQGVVRVLLEYGANANAVDNQGQTPLRRAAVNGHEGVVRVLLEYGADPNVRDLQGQMLLPWTVRYRVEERMRWLSENFDPRTWTREQLLAVLTFVGVLTCSTGCNLL